MIIRDFSGTLTDTSTNIYSLGMLSLKCLFLFSLILATSAAVNESHLADTSVG